MATRALFDKSFLQGLNADESVMFDHHFESIVCPIFYAETLADLAKKPRKDWSSDDEVRMIADKFPEMHSAPCASHSDMCINSLMGEKIPMDGQLPIAGGKPVKADGQTAVIFSRTPESEAFARWQEGNFLDLERDYAKGWRESLAAIDLNLYASMARSIGIDSSACRSLPEAFTMADATIAGADRKTERMKIVLMTLNVPTKIHSHIFERWKISGYPNPAQYAPYATYVATVEIFFQIALAANLISAERASNRTDIAYLYYLPFCSVFISNDKLHARVAPLFLRNDQMYVPGATLKNELNLLSKHYLDLPDADQQRGLISMDRKPIENAKYLQTIWDHVAPRWRERTQPTTTGARNQDFAQTRELIERFKSSPRLSTHEIDFDVTNPDSVSYERQMTQRKGRWWQLPKDLKKE